MECCGEYLGFPGGAVGKKPPASAGDGPEETGVRSLGPEDLWRRKCQPTPVFFAGKPHGQRSLVGYSPWRHRRLGHKSCTHSETRRWEAFTHMPRVLFHSLLALLRPQTRLPALAVFGYQPGVVSFTLPSLDSMSCDE